MTSSSYLTSRRAGRSRVGKAVSALSRELSRRRRPPWQKWAAAGGLAGLLGGAAVWQRSRRRARFSGRVTAVDPEHATATVHVDRVSPGAGRYRDHDLMLEVEQLEVGSGYEGVQGALRDVQVGDAVQVQARIDSDGGVHAEKLTDVTNPA